jgi:signal peptidase I
VYVIEDTGDRPLPEGTVPQILQAVLARKRPFRFRARGVSMTPFVRDGDVITVAPLRTGDPRLGDIVAFFSPGGEELIVHRVVRRRGEFSLIRADNKPEADGLLPRSRVLGKVSRIERKEKRVRLGLGFDRVLIATLSRLGWLMPFVALTRRLLRPFRNLRGGAAIREDTDR